MYNNNLSRCRKLGEEWLWIICEYLSKIMKFFLDCCAVMRFPRRRVALWFIWVLCFLSFTLDGTAVTILRHTGWIVHIKTKTILRQWRDSKWLLGWTLCSRTSVAISVCFETAVLDVGVMGVYTANKHVWMFLINV